MADQQVPQNQLQEEPSAQKQQDGENVILGEDGKPLSANQLKKREKKLEKERKKAETAARLEAEKKARQASEPDFASDRYGKLGSNNQQSAASGEAKPKLVRVEELSKEMDGVRVRIRARVHTTREQAKIVFLTLRQQLSTVQALVVVTPEMVSKQMIKWVGSLPTESIIDVEGVVQAVKTPIKSASISDAEIAIDKIFLIGEVTLGSQLPFGVDEATKGEAELVASGTPSVELDTRLNNRVLDLRTPTNQAIFRLQAAIVKHFRDYLDQKGFVEIHSPKLQGAASESGASVFKVGYFKGSAFLAQSPQLSKQMAIAADFEKVYEIGPVFRAEDSNTHRHMTEFTGLDLEMVFDQSYTEVVDLIDGLLRYVFGELKTKYTREVDLVRRQFNAEPFEIPEGDTIRLAYKQGIELLRADGVELGDMDDLSTENEKRLGRLVKEKYHTDYFILDKFPLSLRPFYTMPDLEDGQLSNSYDFFMRGEEILSGAQRIHEPAFLEQRMKEFGVDPASMKPYVDAFRLGAPPHAGGGIGLERVLMFYLGLKNIRRASLFPRDPKRLEP